MSISELLANNSYPGRGVVIGKAPCGAAALAYFIMGRSENSRNRVFLEAGNGLSIRAYEPEKLTDPTLIIYSPLRVLDNYTIVTNGDQTDTIYDFVSNGLAFEQALATRRFEPDAPNYTPRISGIIALDNGDFSYKLSILKSMDAAGERCSRQTFSYESLAGTGHFIHTYERDGSPIPSFTGEPKCVSIPDDIDEFTRDIWNSLNEVNRVSLYVRYIDPATGETQNRLINGRECNARI